MLPNHCRPRQNSIDGLVENKTIDQTMLKEEVGTYFSFLLIDSDGNLV